MGKYYNQDIDEVLKNLNTQKEGLTDTEAKKRLSKNGTNTLKNIEKQKGLIIRVIGKFKNLMIIVLLLIAILSAYVSVKMNEPYTVPVIIFFVIILNVILALIQESEAKKSADIVKSMYTPFVKVRRNGKIQTIKTEDLVIGDIVIIETGDFAGADMRIIQNYNIKVEETLLTGKSIPAYKEQEKINTKKDLPFTKINNMLFAGSSVVYGKAEAVVTATGMDTIISKIVSSLSQKNIQVTPLQKKINRLTQLISAVILIITIIIFLTGYFKGIYIPNTFAIVIALAIASIPEGLYLVMAITLAASVKKLEKEKVTIKTLDALETLGGVEVICTNKVDTLTQNKMTLTKIYLDNKLVDVENITDIENLEKDSKLKKYDMEKLVNIILLCNNISFGEDLGAKVMLGEETEKSMVEFGYKIGFDKEQLEKSYRRVDNLPYDSTRKMMTTINELENEYMVSTKGEVKSVLEVCDKILIDGKIVELTDEYKNKINDINIKMESLALKILACAYKINDKKEQIDKSENSLVFVGLIGMIDPVRKEAKRAVERCHMAGIIPIMITDDNIQSAISIAKELDILEKETNAVTGTELDNMSDEELYNKVESIRVYTCVSSKNKARIVKAWKKHGKVVAMTGNGVNDALALKNSDVSIGMGVNSTKISQNSVNIVLQDDNFSTIVGAIKEGRRVYSNIQNVIAYLLSTNFAEILIVLISILLNKVILLPIQLLWINLITDIIPAIALGFEREERAIMRQKPRGGKKEGLFTPFLICRIIIPGIIKAVTIFTLYYILEGIYNVNIANTAVFIAFSIIEILFAFICRSDKKSIFKIGILTNKTMIFCMFIAIILQILIIFTPISIYLEMVALPIPVHIIITCVVIGLTIFFELLKLILAHIFNKKEVKLK